jgi:hypothetical protein
MLKYTILIEWSSAEKKNSIKLYSLSSQKNQYFQKIETPQLNPSVCIELKVTNC